MPIEKEDEALVRAASTTHICRACCVVFGEVRPGLVQECSCTRRPDAPKWPGYDFNTAVEICRGCTTVLIPSGSRWHPFFCRACTRRVGEENDRATSRASFIPLGRHSVHQGIMWREERLPRGVLDRLTQFFGRIDELDRIHKRRLRAVFEQLATERVPTQVFLEHARELYGEEDGVGGLVIAFGLRTKRPRTKTLKGPKI